MEQTLAPWAVETSLEHRAPDEADSHTNAAAIATGLDHYRENCVMCHGALNVQPGELAQGFNPPPNSKGWTRRRCRTLSCSGPSSTASA